MGQSRIAVGLGGRFNRSALLQGGQSPGDLDGLILAGDAQYLIGKSSYTSSSDASDIAYGVSDGSDFNATALRLLYLFCDQRDHKSDGCWSAEHTHHAYAGLNALVGPILAGVPLYHKYKQLTARKKAIAQDSFGATPVEGGSGIEIFLAINEKMQTILDDTGAGPDTPNAKVYIAQREAFQKKYKSIKFQLKRVGGTNANPQYEPVLVVEPRNDHEDVKKNGNKWWQPAQLWWDRIDGAFSTAWTLIILYMSAYWILWVPFVMASWGAVESGMLVPGNYAASLSLTIIIPALLFTLPYFAFRMFNNLEAQHPHVKTSTEEHNSDVRWVKEKFFKVEIDENSFPVTVWNYVKAIPYFFAGFFVTIGLFVKKKAWDPAFAGNKTSFAKPDGTLRGESDVAKEVGGFLNLAIGKEAETPLLSPKSLAQNVPYKEGSKLTSRIQIVGETAKFHLNEWRRTKTVTESSLSSIKAESVAQALEEIRIREKISADAAEGLNTEFREKAAGVAGAVINAIWDEDDVNVRNDKAEAAIAQYKADALIMAEAEIKQAAIDEDNKRLARLKQHYQDFTENPKRRWLDAFVKFLVLTVSYFVVSQITLWVVSDAYLLVHHQSMLSSPSFNIDTYSNLPGLAQASMHLGGGLTVGTFVGALLFILAPLIALVRVRREYLVGGSAYGEAVEGEQEQEGAWFKEHKRKGAWSKTDEALRAISKEFEVEGDGPTSLNNREFLRKNRYPNFDQHTTWPYLAFYFVFWGTTGVLMLRFIATGITAFLPFQAPAIGSDLLFDGLSAGLFVLWGAWKIYHMHTASRDEMVSEDLKAHKQHCALLGREDVLGKEKVKDMDHKLSMSPMPLNKKKIDPALAVVETKTQQSGYFDNPRYTRDVSIASGRLSTGAPLINNEGGNNPVGHVDIGMTSSPRSAASYSDAETVSRSDVYKRSPSSLILDGSTQEDVPDLTGDGINPVPPTMGRKPSLVEA